MPYGTIKVDNVTFTNGGVDQNVTVSGLYASTTSNLTVTGTVSGSVILGGTTVSGTTVSGQNASFVSGIFTSLVSGATGSFVNGTFVSGVTARTFTATSTGGVALAIGTNSAIRDTSAVGSTMFFDVSTGSSTHGAFVFRSSSGFTQRLYISDAGNVGIGLIPSTSLDVSGNALIRGGLVSISVSGAEGGQLSLSDKNGLSTSGLTIDVGSLNEGRIFQAGAGDLYLGNLTGGASGDTGRLFLYTNAAERVRVTSTGVAINTNLLYSGVRFIVRDDNFHCRSTFQSTDQRLTLGSYWEGGVDQYSYLQSTNAAATTAQTLFIQPSGGNVGIGASNSYGASEKLTITSGNLLLTSATSFSPQILVENTFTGSTAGYVILQKGRNRNLPAANDSLGTLLWRAYNASGVISNTGTTLTATVSGTPVSGGLVRTYLTINGDTGIALSTINGEGARFTADNYLILGNTVNEVVQFTAAKLQIINGDVGSAIYIRRTNNAFGTNVYYAKSRNPSANNFTALQNGDEIANFFFAADDGNSLNTNSAYIRCFVNGTVASGRVPGALAFATCPGIVPGSSAENRFVIGANGNVYIGAGVGGDETHVTMAKTMATGVGGYTNSLYISATYPSGNASSAEARGILQYPVVESGANIGGLMHLYIAQNILAASGGTINTQYGMLLSSALSAASINYGVYYDLAANTKGGGGTNTNFNIYVNNTAPNYLASNTSIRAGQDTNATLRVGTIDSTSAKYAFVMVNTNNANIGWVRADGAWNTGSATQSPYNQTSASAANLFVDSAGNLYRSTSSARFKKDIETVEDYYADAILNCRPVWYRSTTGNDNANWGYWGFIAEEVAEVDPRLVLWKTKETQLREDYAEKPGFESSYYDPEGKEIAGTTNVPGEEPSPSDYIEVELDEPIAEGVQYDRFVPLLLNLIKRQKQQIENLEQRLAILEANS